MITTNLVKLYYHKAKKNANQYLHCLYILSRLKSIWNKYINLLNSLFMRMKKEALKSLTHFELIKLFFRVVELETNKLGNGKSPLDIQ